jgi:prepilin-type N-terminal cleavage/methylation domain-containing protein
MLAKFRQMKEDEGFTLVELLVVIAILGILAGIVVFSVAGITDTGTSAACKTERSELVTAQEAYFATPTAGNGKYAANAAALQGKFLTTGTAGVPTYYTTTSTTPFTSYSIGLTAAGSAASCAP